MATRDGAVFEYLTYRLTDVAITSIDENVVEGNMATEQLSLSFTRIEIEYTPMDASGKAGTPIRAAWDVAQNKAAAAAAKSDALAESKTGAASDFAERLGRWRESLLVLGRQAIMAIRR